MQKMLAIVPVLFALACGGEGPTTPPSQIKFDCTNVSAASSTFTVTKGETVTVSYSSNCQSVRADASASGFPKDLPASGSFSFTATQDMTVILTGIAPGKPSVSAAVKVNVVVPQPPTLKLTAPSEVYLNQTISVSVQKTNIQSCTPVLGWAKSGKEDSTTIAPNWSGSSFSPGSTMPVGKRVATLKLSCVGNDQSLISDSVTVQLLVPKLEVDSISPVNFPAGCARITAYSKNNSFVSNNGVDFRGTVFGFEPDTNKMVNNPDNFHSSDALYIGACLGSSTRYDYKSDLYLTTTTRSEFAHFVINVVAPTSK